MDYQRIIIETNKYLKMKIRKVEVTSDEFFEALNEILLVDEKIPQNFYMGSNLNFICKSMGIKPLDFWAIKFKFEQDFNKLFLIKKIGSNEREFTLWRKEKFNGMQNK